MTRPSLTPILLRQKQILAFGGGWRMSDRFAIEGNLTTSSPFGANDFPSTARVDNPRPHNMHTTVGVL